MKFCLYLFLCLNLACSLTEQAKKSHPSSSEQVQYSEMKTVYEKILELTPTAESAKNTLVVFDIDNTLLAAQTDLGSDQWYNWKSSQISKLKDSSYFGDLFAWLEILLFQTKQRLTEENVPSIVSSIQARGIPTIALTSRSPDYRRATQRELKANKLDFSKSSIGEGISYKFIPKLPSVKREVSFMNGIFMTKGLHKGQMLKYLLNRYKLEYKQIIFVDDHEKNTNRVFESFKDSKTAILSIRYSKEDENVSNFMKSHARKSKATKKLNLLRETYLKIYGTAPRKI